MPMMMPFSISMCRWLAFFAVFLAFAAASREYETNGPSILNILLVI
jgi:hypothetical protein